MYFAKIASTAEKLSRSIARAIHARRYVRTRRIRRSRSSEDDLCQRTQATSTKGRTIDKVAVVAKALELQPPHLRYQASVNNTHVTQDAKMVTTPQSIGARRGVAGRSGGMNRSTMGIARSPTGTFIQKIHRQERKSLT